MRLFRILFHNQGKVYEIYARRVSQGEIYGFVEVADLSFEEGSTLLIDPGTERLKSELKGVQRILIPLHSVIRVDEVEKEGPAKIHEIGAQGNVTPFPSALYPPPGDRSPKT